MKRAFSLLELTVVILLLSVIYALFLPQINSVANKKDSTITLNNLKEYLLLQEYKQELTFSCIEGNYDCYVHVDGVLIDRLTLKQFFKNIPDVYSYDKQMKRIEFEPLKFDTYEEFDVIFALKFNKKRRHKDLVIESDDGVFVFNSLFESVKRFEYLTEVVEDIQNIENEVKSAF